MDSITHIAVGACIGEAFFEKGFGKKAMLWGALAQSIPDIDFVSHLWLSDASALLAHRGFTHSFLFALFAAPLFALSADKFHPHSNVKLKKWILFFLLEISLHLLLDSLNNYGIGWLEPFSHKRFAFNIVYVADPLFSVLSIIACMMLFLMHKNDLRRTFWWKIGVFSFSFYILISCYNKYRMNQTLQFNLKEMGIHPLRYFTSPAPFQNLLWYVVAETDNGFYIAYKSVLESNPKINFRYFLKHHELANSVHDHESYQQLVRFSDNYYLLDSTSGKLVFSDLRFGQRMGSSDIDGDFVFQFYLNHPDDNNLLIQRGRISGWNWHTFHLFINRIFKR